MLSQSPNGRSILASNGVFDEKWVEWFELTAERDGIDGVQASVGVDDDADVWSDGFADSPYQLNTCANRLSRFESVTLGRQVKTHESPSVGNQSLAVLDHDVARVVGNVWVTGNAVTDEATQQFVHRDPQCLRLNIPQRDVDGTDRCGADSTSRKEPTSQHDLPKVLNASRILTDKCWCECLNAASHRLFSPGNSGLTDSLDPFVGFDDYE
jgi:hypothetical protein